MKKAYLQHVILVSFLLVFLPAALADIVSEEDNYQIFDESDRALSEVTTPAKIAPKDPPLPVRRPRRPKKRLRNLPEPPKTRSRNMAQLPLAVCGSASYNPRGGRPQPSKTYAHPVTGCAFMALLEKWNKKCEQMQPGRSQKRSGCRVAWGHVSYNKRRFFGGHKTHTHGYCIDLRPFRKRGFSNSPLRYTQRSTYSSEYTKKFLLMARKFGSDTTYFNDPKIKRAGLSRHAGGHHNHIHVCFKPGRGTKRACKKWKPDPKTCPNVGGWVKMLKRRGYK